MILEAPPTETLKQLEPLPKKKNKFCFAEELEKLGETENELLQSIPAA